MILGSACPKQIYHFPVAFYWPPRQTFHEFMEAIGAKPTDFSLLEYKWNGIYFCHDTNMAGENCFYIKRSYRYYYILPGFYIVCCLFPSVSIEVFLTKEEFDNKYDLFLPLNPKKTLKEKIEYSS